MAFLLAAMSASSPWMVLFSAVSWSLKVLRIAGAALRSLFVSAPAGWETSSDRTSVAVRATTPRAMLELGLLLTGRLSQPMRSGFVNRSHVNNGSNEHECKHIHGIGSP